MEDHFSVAIDGPSGAGKSTIARAAAKRFGFLYVDTGAIYRTVGLAAERHGVSFGDEQTVEALLPEITVGLGYGENGEQRSYLNGEDVSGFIRTPEISNRASDVSAMPCVRAYLLDLQRSMAASNNVIMDGRDIGTVVLPGADLKIFLTASAEARAMRRCKELRESGLQVSLEDVLREIEERDEHDMSRAAAPLKCARDAIKLDTSVLTLEESIDAVCVLIADKLGVVNR